MKHGKQLGVDYEGLDLPDTSRVAWSEIKDVKYEDAVGGDVMTLDLFEKGVFGSKSNKVKLPGAKPHRDMLKAVLGQYWHRHKVAHGQVQ